MEMLVSYLTKDLAQLQIESAIVFGSATNNDFFNVSKSDVDIVAYSNFFSLKSIEETIEIINNKGGNFVDKEPIFLCDFISPRIEFLYKINDLTFDINIFPPYFYGFENIEFTAAHDSVDLVIGAMYENAVSLFGKTPIEKIIQNKAQPFYNDDIRLKRIEQLKNRIVKLNFSINEKIKANDMDVLKELFKSREYFLKYLFIKYRKYPIDLKNYIYYQLKNFLDMDDNSINILLFKGETFLDIVNQYLNYVDNELNYGGIHE